MMKTWMSNAYGQFMSDFCPISFFRFQGLHWIDFAREAYAQRQRLK